MRTPTTGNSITECVTYTGIFIPEAAKAVSAVVPASTEHPTSEAKDERRQEPARF
ncbi:MAG: hypothetical protein OEW39_08090 [Deltaproteobacteria bacterium]|nr:hypothetical protein [Deltaproteobacteria bacterium]